jgi:hypothetical protein
MADFKTRKRVSQFASEGIDAAYLVDSVMVEPTAPERIIFINPLNGPVKVAVALCLPIVFGSAAAYQYGVMSGPLASALMIGSFSAFILMLGNDPRIVSSEAKQIEIPSAAPVTPVVASDEPDAPSADEVSQPFKNSLTIRFYEPPLRPSGESVPWAAICYACRAALNGTPFSERQISGKAGAKISGPDFRILADDFRRRGYTVMQPDRKTAFTDRGEVQVKKLASLPY